MDPFAYVPPAVTRALGEKYAFFRPVTTRIDASPMQFADIDFSTGSIISVGSQGYNIVTSYCIAENLLQLQITQNGTVIEIMKGKYKGEIIRKPSDRHDIAILERVVDHVRNQTTITIAAGLGVIGSMGAVQYLIDHWDDLRRLYGARDFALVLQFGPTGANPIDSILRDGSIVRRIPKQ
jgi:hypothetical protein